MDEDYSQPFSVGFGKYAIWWADGKEHRRFREFRHQSADGYLEALEPRIEAVPPPEVIIVHRQSSMSAQEARVLEQLARRVDYLQKKLLEKEKKPLEEEPKKGRVDITQKLYPNA